MKEDIPKVFTWALEAVRERRESVPDRDNVAPRSLTHTCTSRMLRHLLGTQCIASVSHAADLAG